jgi:hypothetical protein
MISLKKLQTENNKLLFLIVSVTVVSTTAFLFKCSVFYGGGGGVVNGSFKHELTTDIHRTKVPLRLDLASSGFLEFNSFRYS